MAVHSSPTATRPWGATRRGAVLALLLLAGCSPGVGDSDGAEDCPDEGCPDACVGDGCSSGDDGGANGFDAGYAADVTGVRIEPETADLISADGARTTQAFTAIATLADGTEVAAFSPRFGLDPHTLGEVDVATGLFTANGLIGGSTTVTVTITGQAAEPLSASAALTVRLTHTVRGAGAPEDVAARFDIAPVADPARAAQVVYPLDEVVVPQNVYPVDVQWLDGAAGDLYRVTLTKPHVSIQGFVAYDGLNHWLVDENAWHAVARTDPDDPAVLTVDRLEAATGQLISGASRSITFARAALSGSVYYWDIGRGRIFRIDDGTATRVDFLPSPPVALDGERCVGCHSISPSGRWMAGRLGGGENIGAVFDLTSDLTPDPAPTVWPIGDASLHWWFSSWSPDEERIVVSIDEQNAPAMRLYDPFAGTERPIDGNLPSNATHPAWSPDGEHIAYVTNIDAWGGAFTAGDIGVLPVLGEDSFGDGNIVHWGNSLDDTQPAGQADSYPSWSPDSNLLAFAHGDGCRSEVAHAALFVMSLNGSDVTRLDRASGGASSDDSFQPHFSPFDEGGYFWLSFLSRRDYGNAQVGTRGANRQQVWVAAVRNSGLDGDDPSAVPYWLSGQDPAAMNIAAFWAPRPCRGDGEGCSVGSECCSGDCRPPAEGGAPVCSPPPPEECSFTGEACETSANCCAGLGLDCVNGLCLPIIE